MSKAIIETSGTTTEYKKVEQMKKKGTKPYFPTNLIRPSMFFPISSHIRGQKINEGKEVACAWGSYKLYGYKLSIKVDEPLLLVFTYLSQKHKSDKFVTSYSQICALLGKTLNPDTKKSIKSSIERIQQSGVIQYNNDGTEYGVNFLSGYAIMKRGEIAIWLSSLFSEMFNQNAVTYLDYLKMRELPGNYPKALYRFLLTHSGFKNNWIYIGIKKVAQAINLDKRLLSDIRRELTKACGVLMEHKVIISGSINNYDVLCIKRLPWTKKEAKELADDLNIPF